MTKSILNLLKKKKNNEKIISVTAYDYFTATVAKTINPDFILVGDSLGMVIKGDSSTISVTVDEIIYHSKIVSKQFDNTLIISDMPFLSFNISKEIALENAGKILVDSGVDAVKIEGANNNILDTIKFLTDNNIPVMGHIGLTPQSIFKLGKYKVFGKNNNEKNDLLNQAIELENAGVFAIILECVTKDTAKTISEKISIPVIGIGSGAYTDGQILVISDILGMHQNKLPKFAKQYVNLLEISKKAIQQYKTEVVNNAFPTEKESYL